MICLNCRVYPERYSREIFSAALLSTIAPSHFSRFTLFVSHHQDRTMRNGGMQYTKI